jgi:hypothetical protein
LHLCKAFYVTCAIEPYLFEFYTTVERLFLLILLNSKRVVRRGSA